MKLWRLSFSIVAGFFLGIGLQWAGAHLNQLVIAANNEQMPVWVFNDSVAALLDGDPLHKPLDGKTRFAFLADVLPVQAYSNADGFSLSSAMSIGDVFFYAGVVISFFADIGICFLPVLLIWQIRQWRRRRSRAASLPVQTLPEVSGSGMIIVE